MKKNKKLIIPLLLVGILVLIIGSTYAWLIWVSSEEDKTNITFTATGSFSCSATGVNTIDGSNVTLVPTDCTKVENIGHVIKKEISTVSKNNSSADAYMNMWLNVDGLGSYLANSDNFKYALTTTDNNCATDVVSTGNFKDLATGGRVNILESKKITSTENNTYYLWIWLDEAETTPPEVDETTRSFSLSLGGECTNQEVVDNFTVTNKEVNYQNVKVTANNTQRNIVSYAIVNDTPSDTDWVAIQDVRKTCTLNRVLSTAGEYKVWFKDVDGNTISDTINIANIDTTGPVCTFGSFSKTQIKNQETSTLSLTCTDPETKIKDINLTKESFAYDNKLITISNIARENVSNGYKYTLTITGKGLDGDTSISLPSGNIKNNGDMNNTETSSSTLVILNSTSLSNLTVTLSNNTYTYDGKSKTPEVVVKDGIKKLTLNKDYTIEYKDNINAGTGKVVITGKGNYSGSTTKTFTINKVTATCKINSVPTLKYPNSMSGNLTYNCTGTGNITVASGNTNVITASKTSDTVVSLTGKTIGTSKITISQAESTNYASATISQDITVSAEEYTINFDGNMFSTINKTENSLTITYDYENSYLTLNGIPTGIHVMADLSGLTFTEGDIYTYTASYVSGSYTNTNNSFGSYVLDVNNIDNIVSTRNNADIVFGNILTGSSSANLIINSAGSLEGNRFRFWLYFDTVSDWTFNNYKIKLTLTKNDTKKVTYGGTYGLLPVTYRKGFTFDGWYTGENGTGTKINSSDTVSITNDTTLYAKWIDDIGPYGTANLSLSSNTYTLTLSDQGDDGSGLNTTYGFALTTGTCESATYENQTGTSKTYSGTYTNGTTYYGCVKLTDKVGNISYIRSGGIKNVSSTTYTNSGEQVYTVPSTGIYKLEVWGAQGGQYSTYTPGYGAYSVGYANLTKDTKLYIVNGGSGILASANATFTNGGYNGGGQANYGAGTGGGATHIATANGLLSTLSSQTGNILIVAGGGGGTGVYNANETGGSGGGISGVTGGHNSSSFPGGGTGGTQTSGGTPGASGGVGGASGGVGAVAGTVGTFGSGGKGGYESEFTQGAGGGGGGYYGGAGGSARNGGGGGGSGYIGNSLLTNKYMYCYNCTTSNDVNTKTYTTTNVSGTPTADYAKSGSGATRITFTATTLKLTYNNNGGTGCNTKSVMTGEAYGELCTPIREGYKFDGWYTAESGGTKITASTSVSNNSDHTIYAHWTKSINPIISFGTNGNSGYVKGNVASTINVSRGNANLDESTFKYIYSTSNSDTPNTNFISGSSYTLTNGTGKYYLIAKACDVNGTCTTEVSNPFYVDNEAPTGTVSISLNEGNVLGIVNATDSGSGISSYYYALSTSSTCPTNGYTESANNSYSFSITNNGTYYVCVKIKDKVGNISDTIISSAYTLVKPTITIGTNGNSEYVKGNISSTITVSNGNNELDYSTLKYIYSTSKTDTPNTSFTSGNSYTLEGATGTYYLIAKACNVDGLCTTEVSNPFYVDNTAPTLSLTKETYQEGFDGWTMPTGGSVSNGILTLSQSGTASSDYYAINGERWRVTYDSYTTGDLGTGAGGVHSVFSYYDVSKNNIKAQNGYYNNGNAHSFSLNTWKNDITYNCSNCYGTDTKYLKFSFTTGTTYSQPTTKVRNFKVWGQLYSNSFYNINISKSDNIGIKTTKYASGNQTESYFASNGTIVTDNVIRVTDNNTYTVYVEDAAGNKKISTITIDKIDKVAPSGTISISFSSGTLKGTVSASDNLSGVSSYYYALSTSSTCPTSGYTESTNSSYSFTLSGTGTYYICTKIKDNVGNISAAIRSSAYTLSDTTAPTCTISVSGTTVTATFKDNDGGSGIKGEATKTATINAVKDYTFTAEDNAGNSTSCGITVTSTDHDDGYDYLGAGRTATGKCTCKKGKLSKIVSCHMSGTSAVCSSCPSGYSLSSNGCSVQRTCSSGWTLASNGITCYKWRGINYYCNSGTKINDSYCYTKKQ